MVHYDNQSVFRSFDVFACYVDESGHCGRKFNPEQPFEVLCGALTNFSKLFKTQREQQEIMKILNDHGIAVDEFKGSEIYRGTGKWKGVKPVTRVLIVETILKWAAERTCKFVVAPIDSEKFFYRKKAGCAHSNMFGYPYECGAVKVLLSVQKLHAQVKKNKGKTVFIFDEQPDHDRNILKLLSSDLRFSDDFTGYEEKPRAKTQIPRLDQIVDVPHFSKSHLSSVIQIADVAAFVVNRYLQIAVAGQDERFKGELKQIEGWYDVIGNSLISHAASDPTGKQGLKAYYRSVSPAGWTAKKWKI